jgi:hypothetical protein
MSLVRDGDEMKVGDLVKHKYGTLYGEGLILEKLVTSYAGDQNRCRIMWNCHGNITFQTLAVSYCEVINESR